MARDFMQDILPKDDSPRPKKLEIHKSDEVEVPSDRDVGLPERSIRNINVTRPRPIERPAMERPPMDRREVPPVGGGLPPHGRSGSRLWLWGLAGILLLVCIGLALFMFRSTSVTVIPRSHTMIFDASKTFTAYPASAAPAGTLTYTVQTFDVDDTQPVASSGSTRAERKASGSVTVVNEYSPAPVKLVKNTRFQTPDGLIFRAPADINVPGTKNGNPGSVTVTLFADQAGDKYNIPPTARFTVPGLQGSPMYDKVYARSSSAFAGGFSGNEPAVAADARSAAIAEMQGRLKDKVAQQISSLSPSSGGATIFASLAMITFQDMPATSAATQGQVNLNERAHVQIPVFPTQDLNRVIGSTVTPDAANSNLSLIPKESFGASLLSSTSTVIGSTPITFSLVGSAQLVWQVDGDVLAQALTGKDQAAFQAVVNGFPGVQEARARIEPFWRHTFPTDPKDIQVVIDQPQESPSH